MSTQTLRLILAIAAWPLGLGLWLVWMFWPVFTSPDCPPGQVCALNEVPSDGAISGIVMGVCIAFGPGVLATRAWWQGRGSTPNDG